LTESVDAQIADISRSLAKLGDVIPRSVLGALNMGARLMESDAKQSVQGGTKSGVTYQKYLPKRTHQSSAPGQAPATDQGALVASIRVENKEDGSNIIAGGGSDDVNYAIALEFGTENMLPRPFMQPAFEKNQKTLLKLTKREINKELEKNANK